MTPTTIELAQTALSEPEARIGLPELIAASSCSLSVWTVIAP